MTPDTRSDADVRADDQARAGDDAVETRAISVGNVVRNRRNIDSDAPRAESRGVYRDLDGRRRIVGAGQVIPDGWTRIESAALEDRVNPDADAELADAAGDEKATRKRKPAAGSGS